MAFQRVVKFSDGSIYYGPIHASAVHAENRRESDLAVCYKEGQVARGIVSETVNSFEYEPMKAAVSFAG